MVLASIHYAAGVDRAVAFVDVDTTNTSRGLTGWPATVLEILAAGYEPEIPAAII